MSGLETTASDGSFLRQTLVDGRPATLRCAEIDGRSFGIRGWPISVASLEDEWFEDLSDPVAAVRKLRQLSRPPDLLSFWQRPPDEVPRHRFHLEWDEIAALPVASYERWWTSQIECRARNQFRRAARKGVVVDEVAFDDCFVQGMTKIFNETPVRQGRPFWHYGKSFDTVKQQFSRFVHRESMVGAYLDGEMVGFLMLARADRFGAINQILSSLSHRDKSINNALVAKAVQICAERKLDHLVYALWSDSSLGEFKRRCGFRRMRLPRYYVPLSARGRLALACGAHRGWRAMLPPRLSSTLKQVRARWYARKALDASGVSTRASDAAEG